ncbi:MAG: NADP(H)-dependent aldo-keto reductase [Bacteroidota bacterium]
MDLRVSKICLGTMTFGQQNSEAEAHDQLDFAVSEGINFIDTAEMYAVPGSKETQGLTEAYIGTWLAKRQRRDDVVIATKVTGPSPRFAYIRDPLAFTPEQIRTAVEGSLRRLQTDYIDVYQLHWPERKVNFFGVRDFPADEQDPWEDNFLSILQTMQALIDEGKIRHFGVSNETPWGLMHFLQLAKEHQLPRAVSIQNPYSLLNRLFEVGLSEVAMREQVGLLAYSPLAFGMLSGKYHRGPIPEKGRLTLFDQMSRYNGETARQATQAYLDLADKHELSLTQMALAFVSTRPFTASNIIGATTLAQLRENIGSIQIEISPALRQEINNIHNQIPNPAP